MEIIIDLVARMLVMKTLAPTQGEENSIAMLVPMNVHKNKFYTKIVIKWIAMPTMGVTTNPTTTSSTTWNRHLIVNHMLMLKTKVIKIHRGVISEITLAMTNGDEENRNMIKMRGPSLDVVNNLNNILIVNQVKLVFNSAANPMLWNLEDEENMYGKLKFNMPKFKGEDDAEAYLSWALKVDKIFRIHNYSGAKKVAMASLEFEDYANTWWEQVVTLREEKGEEPIDTWEEMKEEMQARFVPGHYKTDLFNKLQQLKQGTKTVEEFFKEMELTMMRANIQESENQTIARFFNGLNYPIKRIVEFQPYSNMVELVHQASKAERQVKEDIKYSKSKSYFASKLATTDPPTSAKPSVSSTPSKQPTIQSRMKQTVSSTASSKASTGQSNVTCFKCGTQGHKSFECNNTKVMITMENGDIKTLSEGEYEALVQAAVANEEDYDEDCGEDPLLCVHDTSPSLVVTRVLTTQPQAIEDQRCNIFQTRAGIGGKSIKAIIDGGSCHNLASTEMCEKLNLTLRKHPHPYHVQWLSDKGNVKIQHTVTVNFKIGPYEDTVECDVVPMTVCHMFLGRPWQYDNKVIHDGYSNVYTFKVKDKKFELRPMTSSQIIADNAKVLARGQQHIHHSDLRGEGATHQKSDVAPLANDTTSRPTSPPRGTSVKTQAMESKPMERELEMVKTELQRTAGTSALQDRNFRPDSSGCRQDAVRAQRSGASRNFRPEGPELPPTRTSAQVPPKFRKSGDEPRDGEVLRNTERLVTQHNLWVQRQEFKDQLNLFETRINEQYEEVAHNFGQVNQDMNLLREATDNLHHQVTANDANMERRMDSLERAITNLGRRHRHRSTSSSSSTSSHDDYSHDHHSSSSSDSRHGDHHPLVDRTLVMKILAQTQGAESSIAMLVLMNVLNKNKLFTKIVIKRLAMPTMGMTTNPTTTSSTTWTRHLIVKPMWMLTTKVIKSHQGVTSGTILAMPKGAENNHNMIKMRGPSLGNANNPVKIRNNIINFNMPKFKGEDDAEAYLSWALKVDKIFRIHNYSGAKKVAMASLEFEDYANTWWEQVVTLREEKGDPPIDTWEDMKEEMQARFVPTHYKTDLFNKLQKLKQGTKTVEEFFKEMELTMMRANIQESENQTIARFFNGLNYPIKRIVEFQQYSNMVELVHQASKAERQVNEDIKYSKSKQYFASKLATTTPTTSVKPTASSTPSKQPSIQSRMKQTVSSTASSKASTGPSNVTCFKCGTQGHKSFECKNTKVMITMENGDIETLSEGEYEALVQAVVANEEDYDEESGEDPLLCTHDPSPSLVVTRVLTTQPQAMEDQRCNIFQTRAGIGGKSIKVIIDGGSCHNLASTELCEKLNLTLRKHPHPYHVQWLSDKGNVKIQHTVTVNFKIGPYEDTVECDVVPMTVCHMLLGRPWQFDKKAIHDGYSNAYTFKVKDKKFELRPMTPSQIIADNAKALARAQHHTHHSELRGEGATHQKESERHHPHMSEKKSVLLATKSKWREVKDNPSTTIHYVLICKGLSSETNDLTNIPSSLLSLLKEFQDVFPDELPHGLPPLRGIEHRIDLIPGAPLPNRTAYRTNPEDTKEIQRQIQDLLAKGPFMIVYGFEPPTALDILPLPLHQRTNMDFDKRTTAMKKLHEETRATIQDHVFRQATRLNAKKKERVFEEGDLVWVHLRKERFPQERNSKLKPRGDGPFKVLKRINNNAYVIDIPTSKYLVSNTFNISDLSPHHGDEEEQESRTTLSQGGEMM
ncbi:hypothetical protein QYE76_042223 [Lolium multiflorum]|uniref:CCHC-type domain-containing protein n=1 Tax=Lolium multiflorum TaxID=4521 RepID=A0AAD8WUQ7_LOLMU|nr:hypothetical protein QYE76_042223 [Lolium multiflorum]